MYKQICCVLLLLAAFSCHAITYPVDSNVINALDFGVDPAPGNDDTAALNAALASQRPTGATGKIVFLPDGIYEVSDTIAFTEPRMQLQGQSSNGTIIRLLPGTEGFGDVATPRHIVSTRTNTGFSANQFRVYVNDLSIEAGAGNPGAIGLKLHENNTGGARNLQIRSLDPAGAGLIGLDLRGSDKGPGMVRNLLVDGFDTGIHISGTEYSMTFEQLTLLNQNVVGLTNTWNNVQIHGLVSSNSVPVIRNNKATSNNFRWGTVLIVDGEFNDGAADQVAIENEAAVYLRDITTTGYSAVISERGDVVSGTSIDDEYVVYRAESIFPNPASSLQLPVEPLPDVVDSPPGEWVSVEDFGAIANDDLDDAVAVQAAIDSGAAILYFPSGTYEFSDTVVLRGMVRRIYFLESNLSSLEPLASSSEPVFELSDTGADTLIMDQANIRPGDTAIGIRHSADTRTLVIKNGAFGRFVGNSSGRLFVEDVVGGPWLISTGMTAWMRQLNPENPVTKLTNDGGTVWILGMKTEKVGTAIATLNGGQTELLGGLIYPVQVLPLEQPMFINRDSEFSVVVGESAYVFGSDHPIIVEESQNGTTRRLLDNEIPGRVGFGLGGHVSIYRGGFDATQQPLTVGRYYPLDQTSGTVVPDTIGGLNGELSGGEWIPDGVRNGALRLNGNGDSVLLPAGTQAADTVSTEQGAWAVWIRTAVGFTDAAHIIYASEGTTGNGGGSDNEMHLDFDSDGFINFFIEGAAADLRLRSDNALNDGQWHYVVASWDRDHYSDLYVDGVRQAFTGPGSWNVFAANTRLRYGRPNADTRYYSGDMDEVEFYSSPVAHWQILDQYFTTLGVTNYPPAADAGPDLTIQDVSFARILQGQVNDDGQPDSSPVVTWSVEAGAPGVVFADRTAAETLATFPEAGSYQLQLEITDGLQTASDTLVANVFEPLPSPWENVDIADVGRFGWAIYSGLDPISNGRFAVNGSGRRIAGNPASGGDSFHYVWQSISGQNQEIVAYIESFNPASVDGRAGLMFRNDITGRTSANALLAVSQDGLRFQNRAGNGGGTATQFTDNTLNAPIWLRLQRPGVNTVAAAWSDNGVDWNAIGEATVNVGGGEKFIGLAVTSGDRDEIATGEFSNVCFGPDDSCLFDPDEDLLLRDGFEAEQ